MPELPEVETLKNELKPYVLGQVIESVSVAWENMVQGASCGEFCTSVKGRRVESLSRRGKYLIFNLDNAEKLIIHLRMSGSLLISTNENEPKYVRAAFTFNNGSKMYFCDPRKFGKMRLVKDGHEMFARLGPEPLEEDFTAEVLRERLKNRSIPIKTALLDQSIVAGVGNMYADEALFEAGIYPLSIAGEISGEDVKKLYRAIRKVLRKAIMDKGASISNYFHPDGSEGKAQNSFKVAHRRGENCVKCSTPLGWQKVRGRGTYFCPKCQKRAGKP